MLSLFFSNFQEILTLDYLVNHHINTNKFIPQTVSYKDQKIPINLQPFETT